MTPNCEAFNCNFTPDWEVFNCAFVDKVTELNQNEIDKAINKSAERFCFLTIINRSMQSIKKKYANFEF